MILFCEAEIKTIRISAAVNLNCQNAIMSSSVSVLFEFELEFFVYNDLVSIFIQWQKHGT